MHGDKIKKIKLTWRKNCLFSLSIVQTSVFTKKKFSQLTSYNLFRPNILASSKEVGENHAFQKIHPASETVNCLSEGYANYRDLHIYPQ